jgi:hypothetical protein
MHLKEIVLETVGWINLCQDIGKCRAVVNTVMNLKGYYLLKNVSASWNYSVS